MRPDVGVASDAFAAFPSGLVVARDLTLLALLSVLLVREREPAALHS